MSVYDGDCWNCRRQDLQQKLCGHNKFTTAHRALLLSPPPPWHHMHKYFPTIIITLYHRFGTTTKWNDFVKFFYWILNSKWNTVHVCSRVSESYQLAPAFVRRTDCHPSAVSRARSFHATPRLVHSPTPSSTPSKWLTVTRMTTEGLDIDADAVKVDIANRE